MFSAGVIQTFLVPDVDEQVNHFLQRHGYGERSVCEQEVLVRDVWVEHSLARLICSRSCVLVLLLPLCRPPRQSLPFPCQ